MKFEIISEERARYKSEREAVRVWELMIQEFHKKDSSYTTVSPMWADNSFPTFDVEKELFPILRFDIPRRTIYVHEGSDDEAFRCATRLDGINGVGYKFVNSQLVGRGLSEYHSVNKDVTERLRAGFDAFGGEGSN